MRARTSACAALLLLSSACGLKVDGASDGDEFEPAGDCEEGSGQRWPGPCEVRQRWRSQGQLELSRQDEYGYDDNGNEISHRAVDGSGTLLHSSETEYDESGREVSNRGDSDGDGRDDWGNSWTYDDTGMTTGGSYWSDRDGEREESSFEYRRETDEFGRVTLREDIREEDGERHVTTTRYEHDETGALIGLHEDHDGDGEADWSRWNEFDAEGRVAAYIFDTDGDGRPDKRCDRLFDKDGEISEYRCDEGLDGVVDSLSQYQRDDQGRLRSERHVELGPDGRVIRRELRTYDEAGRLIAVELDSDGNGAPDAVFLYMYDAQGRLVLEEQDDGDGDPELQYRHFYDCGGNLLRTTEDHEADGRVEGVYDYSYDCWQPTD